MILRKRRFSEIIAALNDLFGAVVTDENKLTFANGIAALLGSDEALIAKVNSHSPEQVVRGTIHNRVVDAVLDVMTDNEKLSLEVLDIEVKSRAFALVILKMLTS